MARHEINMTQGSMIKNMIQFAIPLMLSSILQLLYNAADQIVVGRWGGEECLAAVGATSTITTLLTNIFVGLSIGGGVVISKKYGAQDVNGLSKTAHTHTALGIISGIAGCIIGQFACRPVLQLLGTPADIIDLSELYLRIVLMGVPASMVYNFGAAILRSVGDTKRPLYILSVTGMVNVVLNLILVIGLGMDVAGVAIATITAQYLSAAAVMYILIFSDVSYRISLKKLHLDMSEVKQIASIGVPTAVESSLFTLSSMVVNASVNSFGTSVIAGRAAAANIESVVHAGMLSFHHATVTSVGQNYGAKDEKRIYKTIGVGTLCASIIGIVLGGLIYVFGKQLLGLYIVDSQVAIREGLIYITVCGLPYFLNGIMNVFAGTLRGLGYSKVPAMNTLICTCGFRILWIIFVLPFNHTTWFLYLCFPISWLLVIIMNAVYFMLICKKIMGKMYAQ